MSVAVDTERFRKRLLDERSRAQGALDYLHEENSRSMDDNAGDILIGHVHFFGA